MQHYSPYLCKIQAIAPHSNPHTKDTELKKILFLACVLSLSGCVIVDGNPLNGFGIDENELFSKEITRIKTPTGDVVLRLTHSDMYQTSRYQMKLYDRHGVYDIKGRYGNPLHGVNVENVSTLDDGSTVIVLQASEPNCERLIFLVTKDDIREMKGFGCKPFEYGQPDGSSWLMRTAVPDGVTPISIVSKGKLFSTKDDRPLSATAQKHSTPVQTIQVNRQHSKAHQRTVRADLPPPPTPVNTPPLERASFKIPERVDESRVDSKPVKLVIK